MAGLGLLDGVLIAGWQAFNAWAHPTSLGMDLGLGALALSLGLLLGLRGWGGAARRRDRLLASAILGVALLGVGGYLWIAMSGQVPPWWLGGQIGARFWDTLVGSPIRALKSLPLAAAQWWAVALMWVGAAGLLVVVQWALAVALGQAMAAVQRLPRRPRRAREGG